MPDDRSGSPGLAGSPPCHRHPVAAAALQRTPAIALAAVGAAVTLWASAFAAIRAAVPYYGGTGLTAGRLLVACLAFGVIAPFVRVRLPARDDLGRLTLAGLVGLSGYQLLLSLGQVRVTAATASIIIALAPPLTAVFALTMLKERVDLRRWIGLAVALTGVALVTFGEGEQLRWEPAALLVLLAAVAHAAYMVIVKPLLAVYRPIDVTACATWLGGVVFIPILALFPTEAADAPLGAHAAVLHLGVGASAVGFFAWSIALRHIEASVAAAYLYLIPPLAAVIAWVWLGEVPTPLVVAGGAVALGGVAIAQVRTRGRGKPGPYPISWRRRRRTIRGPR